MQIAAAMEEWNKRCKENTIIKPSGGQMQMAHMPTNVPANPYGMQIAAAAMEE
jgi:hypothetical protein